MSIEPPAPFQKLRCQCQPGALAQRANLLAEPATGVFALSKVETFSSLGGCLGGISGIKVRPISGSFEFQNTSGSKEDAGYLLRNFTRFSAKHIVIVQREV